ncbi:cupin domain-containing protein [Mucilaginibacter sp. FT3.2]|uniref:cupin domain-containing protein n=1 Tax=Mucilaginibacter sp. FT3.2 TaxID=2723090 RepID=UPI00160750D5|nr:cupin domain-containing protein [Mucilaginibacter sp. FT3.2]MBB6232500.1 quercetin dioxygenase-like cupin family protein [Mucilaginibacter sp. FT3.2]
MKSIVVIKVPISYALIIFAAIILLPFKTIAQSKSVKGSPGYFTGNVWVNLLPTDTTKHCSVAEVSFEKGARSNWHFHPDQQVLVITEGSGYLKIKGKPVQILHQGDVVTIPSGAIHWHGSTPDNSFTQIVINPNTDRGVVNWLQKVSDTEYKSSK